MTYHDCPRDGLTLSNKTDHDCPRDGLTLSNKTDHDCPRDGLTLSNKTDHDCPRDGCCGYINNISCPVHVCFCNEDTSQQCTGML